MAGPKPPYILTSQERNKTRPKIFPDAEVTAEVTARRTARNRRIKRLRRTLATLEVARSLVSLYGSQ